MKSKNMFFRKESLLAMVFFCGSVGAQDFLDFNLLRRHAPEPITREQINELGLRNSTELRDVKIRNVLTTEIVPWQLVVEIESPHMVNLGGNFPMLVMVNDEPLAAVLRQALASGERLTLRGSGQNETFFYGAQLMSINGQSTKFCAQRGMQEYINANNNVSHTSVVRSEDAGQPLYSFELRNLKTYNYLNILRAELGYVNFRDGSSAIRFFSNDAGVDVFQVALKSRDVKSNHLDSEFSEVPLETLDTYQDIVEFSTADNGSLAKQLYSHLKFEKRYPEERQVRDRDTSRGRAGTGVYKVSVPSGLVSCSESVSGNARQQKFACVLRVRIK